MPSCRPQMLHQLQTSSFLRSPSFPALQPPRIERRGRERERQGEEEIYAVFKLTTSHCYSPLLPLLPILSFRSHLSTSSRTMTQVICKRKGGKGGKGWQRRHVDTEAAVVQRDTNFRLNLTQGARGQGRCARRCFR